jgi:hypothetical protein
MTEPIVPGRLDRYAALALQIDCDGVHPDHDRESAARRMQASLIRIGQALEGARRWIGPELKLVVLRLHPTDRSTKRSLRWLSVMVCSSPETATRPIATFPASTSKLAGSSILRATGS